MIDHKNSINIKAEKNQNVATKKCNNAIKMKF